MEGTRPPFVREVKDRRPDKKVEVWVQDEARFGQQGTLTHVWGLKGSRPTAVKQTEYQWCYLYAAVNPATGESAAMLAPSVDTDYMTEHLRIISETLGPDRHAVLVLDGAGWHVSRKLKVPDNVTLLLLPPYSPELNPAERLWAYLRSHYLSNRVYLDYDDLFAAGRDAWNRLTEAEIRSICHTSWISSAGAE